jgi:hypothetical protein
MMKKLLSIAILLGFALVVLTSPAVAQNCSSSPIGANTQVSAANWQTYAAWCSTCGGIPDSSTMSCKPGPNWGRTAGQGSSGVNSSVNNAAFQAGYQFGQGLGKLLFGDPQAQQRAMQDNQRVMQSLDQMTRERVGLVDQMLRYFQPSRFFDRMKP